MRDTKDMSGDEDYLFDGYDVINRLTFIKEYREGNNKNKIGFRYSRRSEDDSSSEIEGSDDEKIENENNDISFLKIQLIIIQI